jgi:large subunit ribosomal protein L18
MSQYIRKKARQASHIRLRKKLSGSTERPRLAVHFSQKNIYAQVIDDTKGETLASASSQEKGTSLKGASIKTATEIGRLVAERAKGKNVSTVVFDRGGFTYHGKVKALADAAREAGLQF